MISIPRKSTSARGRIKITEDLVDGLLAIISLLPEDKLNQRKALTLASLSLGQIGDRDPINKEELERLFAPYDNVQKNTKEARMNSQKVCSLCKPSAC
jgi:hypothetical protein